MHGPCWDRFVSICKCRHVLIEYKLCITKCRYFLFALVVQVFSTKYKFILNTCHKMFCILHHTWMRWCTNVALESKQCQVKYAGRVLNCRANQEWQWRIILFQSLSKKLTLHSIWANANRYIRWCTRTAAILNFTMATCFHVKPVKLDIFWQ